MGAAPASITQDGAPRPAPHRLCPRAPHDVLPWCRLRSQVPPLGLRFIYDGATRPFNVVSGGFAAASVSADGLTVVHYNARGEELHQATVRPRARAAVARPAGEQAAETCRGGR
eukprot:378747-Prymnesium_polylepis.1